MIRRNLFKIPQLIIDRIRAFDQDDVVVACVKLLRSEDVPRYVHLGVALAGTQLTTPAPAVPKPAAGRYSRANVEGYEKVRKDLPMVKKEFGFDAPNWGDWSNGSHYVSHTRDVYQREFYPPKEVELSITPLEERNGGYLVKFQIEQVISRRTPNFEQELVGAVDVFASAASLADYTASVRVDWQLLPPGSVDEVVRSMLTGKRPVTVEQEATVKARVAAMNRLKPEMYVTGTDGFLRYFGAKFGDDFVVFENIRYGNAIYVMYENWQTLSKRSRIDLLAGPRESFVRIEHRDGWEQHLKALVNRYRAEHKAGQKRLP